MPTNSKIQKVGMSSCYKLRIDRPIFEEYAASGIEAMEISLPHDQYAAIDWQATAKNARETGVELWSLHLPFSPFATNNIASLDKDVRRATLELHSELIKKAGNIGIPVSVIHPSGEPNPDEVRGEMLKYAADSLSRLAEIAAREGQRIAVEDLPRSCLGNCAEDIEYIISADERLEVCFDTNHLLMYDNVEFVRKVGSRIITLHVSDYDKKNERHWLPGEGVINWTELVHELEKVSYSGPFMYEIANHEVTYIDRRELTCTDFRQNFEAVMAGVKPPLCGTVLTEKCDENNWVKMKKEGKI